MIDYIFRENLDLYNLSITFGCWQNWIRMYADAVPLPSNRISLFLFCIVFCFCFLN